MEATEVHLLGARTMRENIARFISEPAKQGLLPLNYRHFLRSASGYAFRVSTSPKSYVAAISEFAPLKYFAEYLELCRDGAHAPAFASASVDMIDLVSIPILLDEPSLARTYISEALASAGTTPVLRSYVEGLSALAKSKAFQFTAPPKLRGIEHHWSLYIALMSQLSCGVDTHGTDTEIEQSFARSNSDRRLQNVGHLDPTGLSPVPWDIRAAYLRGLNDQRA